MRIPIISVLQKDIQNTTVKFRQATTDFSQFLKEDMTPLVREMTPLMREMTDLMKDLRVAARKLITLLNEMQNTVTLPQTLPDRIVGGFVDAFGTLIGLRRK